MIDLSGEGIRAVLIGTGRHVVGSTLPDVPSASAAVSAIAEYLVERCGLAEARIRTVIDPDRPEDIIDAILDEADSAYSGLLLYYVGHGVLDPDGALYLATRATKDLSRGKAAYQALPYEQIGKELRLRRIPVTVVLLDCCYSARANLPVPDSSFLIASADRNELAIAEPESEYPAFSGALIQLLREGDPFGPRLLTLRATYQFLARALADQRGPAPKVTIGGDTGDLVLAINVAYQEPESGGARRLGDGTADETCPYRGLAPYSSADASWFRGRGAVTEMLVRRLADRTRGGGPLVVLGASGSGKSSLLSAGLLPAVRGGELGIPGSATWPAILFTPGPEPMRALVDALHDFVPTAKGVPTAIAGELADGARLVVVVDQFEELFTLCADDIERQTFVAALAALTSDDDPVACVVLGLRADFLASATAYPVLVDSLARDPVVVGPMTTGELRAAIREPADLAGLGTQSGLTEILLHDIGTDPKDDHATGYDPGVLPFLSFALQKTWLVRRDRMLTVDGYRSTGGIESAIANAANATYASLSGAERIAAQQLLLRLVVVGEAGTDTRRVVARTRLLADSPDPSATGVALDAFVAARLLTLDDGDTVEITHEALIRGWPSLHNWIDDDRTGNQVRQRIAVDAEEWRQNDWDRSLLYAGTKLATAREHVADDWSELGIVARRFLASSMRQQRHSVWRRRTLQVTLAMLAAIALVAAVVAAQQRGAAVAQSVIAGQQRDVALSRQLAAESATLLANEPNLAKQLALAGHAISPTSDATAAVFASTDSPGSINVANPVNDLAFSPNGRMLAIATTKDIRLWNLPGHTLISVLSTDGDAVSRVVFDHAGDILAAVGVSDQSIRLWHVTGSGGAQSLTTLHDPIANLAFSPDDHTLVGGGYDGAVYRWDLTSPRQPATEAPLIGHTGIVFGVAVSPDGQLVASSGADGTVRLWRITGSPVMTLHGFSGAVDAVSFAPQGRELATVDSNALQLWDVTVPEQVRPLATVAIAGRASSTVTALDFAQDGRTLGCTCARPTVWDVTNPRQPAPLSPLPSKASDMFAGLRFSRDSTLVAAATTPLTTPSIGTIYLWRTADFRQPGTIATLPGQTANVLDMAYATTSRLLAIVLVGPEREVDLTIWDLNRPDRPKQLATLPGSGVNGLAFRPDGEVLAVTRNGAIELWDTSNPAHPAMIGIAGTTGSDEITGTPAFSHDGTELASEWGTDDSRLWSVADVRHPVAGHVFPYESVFSFSPTASTLIVGGFYTPTAELWDVRDPMSPVRYAQMSGPGTYPDDLAISPDGRTVAVNYDSATQLWDITNPNQPLLLSMLTGYTGGQTVVFGPTGSTLAISDNAPATQTPTATVVLWDLSDPRHPTVFATLATGPEVLFISADGLVGAGDGGTANIWPASSTQAIRLACADVGDIITNAQWQNYLPDEPYRPPCR